MQGISGPPTCMSAGMQNPKTPAVAACLTTPYSAKPDQKGGTLIIDSVTTMAEHRELVCDSDVYRPEGCPRCGCVSVHAHDFRERVLVDQDRVTVERIRRYQCAHPECGAVWRILPAVIARHLHRTWQAVQDATSAPSCSKLPASTLRRWLVRLQLVATQLIQLLAATADPAVLGITDHLSISCSRAELVAALTGGGVLSRSARLEQLAAWVHRLQPGIRLM